MATFTINGYIIAKNKEVRSVTNMVFWFAIVGFATSLNLFLRALMDL